MNKLLQNKSLLLVSVLVLFTISCNEKKINEPLEQIAKKEGLNGELTIETAKQWFNKKILQNANSRTVSTKKPMWEYATQYVEKNGVSVVVAPVLVDEKDQTFGVMYKKDNETELNINIKSKKYEAQSYSTPQKMLMFKDKNGIVQTYLMKVVADMDYFENSLKKDKKEHGNINDKDFDGMILFFDWNDTKIGEAYRYEKGKLTEQSTPEKNKKNGKIAGCSFSTYQEGVSCPTSRTAYSCYIEYTVTTCIGGSSFEPSIMYFTPSIFVGNGGGSTVNELPINYKSNTINAFVSQSAQYGVSFNPDEKLDFSDYFSDFLNLKDDLLDAIKKWGTLTLQGLENKIIELRGRLNYYEKTTLTDNGIYTYRINLLLYLRNAFNSPIFTKIIMNEIGNNGTEGSVCNGCRGNAVKHATFNILNVDTFGSTMAKALGDAHEMGQTPIIDSQMDLHNNSIGLSLYSIYGGLEAINMLKTVVNNGMPGNSNNGLKFLKNGQLVWTKDFPTMD